jgi:hypothetical protein
VVIEKKIIKKRSFIKALSIPPVYISPSPKLPADHRVSFAEENYMKKIYRYGEDFEPVSYAWEKWKDIDFILMIQEESLWDENILGDE